MSETDFLKLKKHDNVETNTDKFDIENYLNGNWDKINGNAKKVNTDISNINLNNTELEKELKEAQEDFYQNSIRGQASGEYIHVEDSSNCRARIGIGGNQEQETRVGYNKLNMSNAKGGTSGGITCVINEDGSYQFKGTATTTDNGTVNVWFLGYYNSEAPTLFTLEAGTYYINDVVLFSGIKQLNKPLTKIYTFTSEVNITGVRAMSATSGQTYNEVKYPIIAKSNKELTWEQYGAMPSLDYQNEIKTVGSNVNMFNKDNYIKSKLYINKNENKFSEASMGKSFIFDISKYNKLTISKVSSERFGVFASVDYPQKDGVGTYLQDVATKTTSFTYDFTEFNYLVVMYYLTSETITEQQILDSIKLEKGTVATPWSQHNQGCVKVTKCNTNLYDGKNEVGGINNDGSLSSTTDRWRTINYINVKSLKNLIIRVYDIETSGALGRYCLYDDKYNFLSSAQILNTKTDLKVDNASYLKFWFLNEKVASSAQVQVQVQVEEGTTAKEYNKHEEQSYIMPVQQEMLENDYFDYDNEEEVHTWGKLVLNGTEKIGISGASTDAILAVVYDINNAIDGFGYSNCFLYSSQVALNKLNVYNNGKNLRVCVDKSKFVDLESFKSKIIELYNEGTPVVVYYKLVTPTRLAFTDEQKAVAKELNNARTYKNVTNITTDSKAILSLDYAKDQETQNQKMQNEIDEIKQLLSTTQTSAMLLDNLQKEVESEVE